MITPRKCVVVCAIVAAVCTHTCQSHGARVIAWRTIKSQAAPVYRIQRRRMHVLREESER